MGTLESIILILSYVKHNPGCKFDDIFYFLNPDADEADYEDWRPELQSFILGLKEDGLLDLIRNYETGDYEHFIGQSTPMFAWGFQTSIDSQKTVTTTVVQTYCHLGSETEPSLQTLMQFSRQQARQQLMQLIGALL